MTQDLIYTPLFGGSNVNVKQPTREERFNVEANFCNIFDDDGEAIFTAFLPQAETLGFYDRWIKKLVDAGSNHIAFSTFAAYRIDAHQYMASFNWLDQPERFAAFVKKVSETPGANGKAITPIIFLDDGGVNPLPRIRQYWPALAAAMKANGVINRCIIICGWEPVVGDWSSYELNEAMELQYQLFHVGTDAIFGWHGSPKRWVGSSNPVQADDPWQGGEHTFADQFSGKHIELPFYQAEADSPILVHCDYMVEDCWTSRWYDGVIRYGQGINDWRKMEWVCLAEGPAFLAIRKHVTSQEARIWATEGKKIGDMLGVKICFMNGLPL